MWMLEWKGLLCGLWPKYWPLGLGLGLGLGQQYTKSEELDAIKARKHRKLKCGH